MPYTASYFGLSTSNFNLLRQQAAKFLLKRHWLEKSSRMSYDMLVLLQSLIRRWLPLLLLGSTSAKGIRLKTWSIWISFLRGAIYGKDLLSMISSNFVRPLSSSRPTKAVVSKPTHSSQAYHLSWDDNCCSQSPETENC